MALASHATAPRCAFGSRQERRVVARHAVQCRASTASSSAWAPPSQRTGANELQALARMSNVVPDTLLLESSVQPKAATVSSLLLSWLLNTETTGLKPFANAIGASLNYDKCLQQKGDAKLNCQLDKALANVGALMANQVEGRICTEIDPRLANDKAAIIAKAKGLVALYTEMGVPQSKLIFRVPATWAGIQAAAALESEGIATQAFHIYSFIQGVAAAQAGVSVVQPNVGRTRDWYNKNPGVIRDPHGPREDSGFSSSVDTGVRLASQLYIYCKKFHPKTQVMASGLRTKADALALAGCDYLVLTAKVMGDLESSATLQGYNTGLTAAGSMDEDGIERQLSEASAKASDMQDVGQVTEARFTEELGPCGTELLKQGVNGLVRDVETVLPYFRSRATGMD